MLLGRSSIQAEFLYKALGCPQLAVVLQLSALREGGLGWGWSSSASRCRKTPLAWRGNVPQVGVDLHEQTASTYLFLLLIEVVNDDTDEQVQSEKGAEDDEDNKIYVHVDVVLVLGLLFLLKGR